MRYRIRFTPRFAWALAAVLISVLIWSFLSASVYKPEPWHLEGTLTDEQSMPLPGVHVVISGVLRVTIANQLLGTSPTTTHFETVTDENGKFVADFRTAFFGISFQKAGYAEERRHFGHTSRGATNRSLRIKLRKMEKTPAKASATPAAVSVRKTDRDQVTSLNV